MHPLFNDFQFQKDPSSDQALHLGISFAKISQTLSIVGMDNDDYVVFYFLFNSSRRKVEKVTVYANPKI